MNKLKDLTLEELIHLYDECIPDHEQAISDECFRRYSVSLVDDTPKSFWQRNRLLQAFISGVLSGLLLKVFLDLL